MSAPSTEDRSESADNNDTVKSEVDSDGSSAAPSSNEAVTDGDGEADAELEDMKRRVAEMEEEAARLASGGAAPASSSSSSQSQSQQQDGKPDTGIHCMHQSILLLFFLFFVFCLFVWVMSLLWPVCCHIYLV